MSISFLVTVLLLITPPQKKVTLTIEITHLHSSDGHVLLQVYNEKQQSIKGATGNIDNEKSIILIEDLNPGKYAFRYFHDGNDNDEIETNWMGLPIEGFGFSNNAKGLFGPPSFDKWVFELNTNKKMICQPKYLF